MVVVFIRHGGTGRGSDPLGFSQLQDVRCQQPFLSIDFDRTPAQLGAVPRPVGDIVTAGELGGSGWIGPPEHARATCTALLQFDFDDEGVYFRHGAT